MRGMIVALAMLALVVVSGQWSVVKADGGWTPRQQEVIGLIYTYADYYGLRPADRDLLLRVAYRETRFGVNVVGDGGNSVGVFQWYRWGVWQSTPCYVEYGWQGRWNLEADVSCAAWAFSRGYQSHWRPWDFPAGSWLAVVPDDPRGDD